MNKWINELKFGTITSGASTGLLALQVEFTGMQPTEEDVVNLAHEIMHYKMGPFKNVMLSGKYYTKHPEYMFTLTQALKNHGYLLQATIDGKIYYPWLSHVKWLIVELQDPVWVGFSCNELRVDFSQDLIEPVESPDMIPIRYLNLKAGFSNEEVFKFIKKAKNPWNILLKSEGVFE